MVARIAWHSGATDLVITIDGYAGTGKSEAARRLAEFLRFDLLNTGFMYRAAAFVLLKEGFAIEKGLADEPAIGNAVARFRYVMPPGEVWLCGDDLTQQVQTESMGKNASIVAEILPVRRKLQEEQRRLAQGRDMVCEGRDQGTVVFPNAEVKFFFKAAVDVRAVRRVLQLRERGVLADLAKISNDISERDKKDETREIDPLYPAADAETIDTTELTRDEVLVRMLAVVNRCRSQS